MPPAFSSWNFCTHVLGSFLFVFLSFPSSGFAPLGFLELLLVFLLLFGKPLGLHVGHVLASSSPGWIKDQALVVFGL